MMASAVDGAGSQRRSADRAGVVVGTGHTLTDRERSLPLRRDLYAPGTTPGACDAAQPGTLKTQHHLGAGLSASRIEHDSLAERVGIVRDDSGRSIQGARAQLLVPPCVPAISREGAPTARVDEQPPVAPAGQEGVIVARQEHGGATTSPLVELTDQRPCGRLIETVESFVEHEQPRTMKQGQDDRYFATHPLGELPADHVQRAGEAEEVEEALGLCPASGSIERPYLDHETDRFGDCELVVEEGELGNEA